MAGGVDVAYDAGHDLGLRLADRGVVGNGLPVDVAWGYHVAVHEDEPPHATAREDLGAA